MRSAHKLTLPAIAAFAALAMTGVSAPAEAASFDCAKPDLAADEKAICDDRALNDADVRMVTTFELVSGLMAMGSKGTLQDEQVAWLKTRQACEADVECLKQAYDVRLKQLMTLYGGIERPL